jgi:hypothetical protein
MNGPLYRCVGSQAIACHKTSIYLLKRHCEERGKFIARFWCFSKAATTTKLFPLITHIFADNSIL